MSEYSGYSGRPLYVKLGMKAGSRWKLIRPPQNYQKLLGASKDVSFLDESQDLDGIHVFTTSVNEVEDALVSLKDEIKKNGMIWVSWYKKSSGIVTNVSENVIRDTALKLGLVDVKVCSVSQQWSALKIVWRKENR